MPASGVSATRRAGRLLTGLGALVALLALLAGTPIVLLALAGNPLPTELPTLAEVGTVLTSRDDGQLFLRALALAGWAGWASFALSVLVEVPARLLRRPAPRLPGLHRQQRMAAALIGSAALILAASPAATAATSVAAAPAVVATSVTAPPPAAAVVAAPAVSTVPTASTVPAQSRPTPPTEPVYRVEKGDYLGHIAGRYLGDFDRYPELAKYNKIRNPDRIRPGQLLRLPEDAVDHGVRPHATGLVALPAPPVGADRPAPDTPLAPPPAVPIPVQPPGAHDEIALTGGAAGANRGTLRGTLPNRTLAVSAVITVAGMVGAQVGAVLGLRRRTPRPRAAVVGRHRLDRSPQVR